MSPLAADILAEDGPHRERLHAAISAEFFTDQLHHNIHASFWVGAVKLHSGPIGEFRGGGL